MQWEEKAFVVFKHTGYKEGWARTDGAWLHFLEDKQDAKYVTYGVDSIYEIQWHRKGPPR